MPSSRGEPALNATAGTALTTCKSDNPTAFTNSVYVIDSTGLVFGNCAVITSGVTILVAAVLAETVRSKVPFASTDKAGLMLVVKPTTEVGGVNVAAPLKAAPVSFKLIVCAAPPFWIASGLLTSFRKMLVETIWGAITRTPSMAGWV